MMTLNTHLDKVDAWKSLVKYATTFRCSAILYAALELDIFLQLLKGPCKLNILSKKCRTSPESLILLLNCLIAMKIIKCDDKFKYSLDDDVKKLIEIDYESIRNNLLLYKRENDLWNQLPDILRGDSIAPTSYQREFFASNVDNYIGLKIFNSMHAEKIIPIIYQLIKNARTMIDIGGGDGYYAQRAIDINPTLDMSILDLPHEFSSSLLGSNYLKQGRLSLIEADARNYMFNRRYDLILVNELFELFSFDDKLRILLNLCTALEPNGSIVIIKFTLEACGYFPESSALFSLKMFLKSPGAYLETDDELSDIIEQAGCRILQKHVNEKTVFVITKREDMT